VRDLKSVSFLLLMLSVISCSGGDTPTAETNSSAPVSPETAAATGTSRLELPGASIEKPADWLFREPASSMRLAEAEVPGPGGPAVLTVFFFGPGGGGGTEANLQRWAGQIQPDSGVEPESSVFQVDDFMISTISLAGTMQPSRMGTGPTEAIPGSKLLGAVIDGPGGPWFFKVTGPAETVTAAEPAFDAMLRSVQP